MKHSFLILLILLVSQNTKATDKILFEIGKQDNSAAEFALYPNNYSSFLANFGGEKPFYVGYSTAEKHWPYVLPGPLDNWAGGGYWAGYHPRHFPSIYFNLDKVSKKEECLLSIFFVGIHDSNPVKVRLEINGHRFEKELKGKNTLDLLENKERGKLDEIKIQFPSSWLTTGMNKIQLGIVKGTWAIFDCIRLETPASVQLGKASSSLIRSVKSAPFEYQDENGLRTQPILVDMTQLDASRKLTFQIEGSEPVSRIIETGESIQEIYMPTSSEKGKKEKLQFTIRDGENIIYQNEVVRSSQPLHTYSDDVDLLMGTGNSRWMFKPGPSLPLSMVQIAPDNQDEIWKAGYEYTIENIMGFNHFSDWTMTGFLMQPTCGKLEVNPGREDFPDEGYRSRIDKKSEKAEIGKYSVYMTDTKIKAEITATHRAALQRYVFPARNDSRILIDMFTPNEYPHNLQNACITKVSDTEIEGYATYYNAFTGYTLEQSYTLYFVLQFSKPFNSMGGWVNEGVKPVTGYIGNWNRNHVFDTPAEIKENITRIEGKGDVGIFLNYKTKENEEILVRSGVSLVDMEGARNNLKQELTDPFGWDFEKVVKNARSIWDEYLGRIEIETSDYLQKRKFYTNLYRALAAKAIWSDVDGRFVDENEKIKQLEKPDDCIVSGEYWNTFWNNQQLFNLIAPEISSKWARSAIQLYKNTGWFNTDPAGVEHTGVMVAMHPISQILGAWQSGIRDFDLQVAYDGLKKMMTIPPQKYEGGGTVGVEHLVPYMKYGYIPAGKGTVSNTMEYAYDDWCLGQMAQILGKEADSEFFYKRSDNWYNLFDSISGFIRPKDEYGQWIEPFDPYHTPGFTEGNAFNYSWFVPHNPRKLIRMVGKERFINRLDKAMEQSSLANFNAAGDNFSAFPINHGNETSMEVAYLFNWAGAPWLTQKWIRAIQEQYYGTTPYDAYPGDEDLGQMSSWFVMSTLGLFQMDGGCSVNPSYELASPRYPKVTIHLGGKYGRGKTFVIEAPNASKENKYIHSVTLNGEPVNGFKIPQEKVLKGGKMTIEMGKEIVRNKKGNQYQAGAVDMEIKQRGESKFPSGFSAFSLDDHFVWCGSAIQAEEDGKYYLFYSAMESGAEHSPFVDAWLLGSKIGVAVSDSPYGGYKNIGFVYNKDGYKPDQSSWDAQTVSNTHIKRFNGKYYLYYCGSVDAGESACIKGVLSKRDRIQQNQKLGVLCFNSIRELLEGKFTCNEQPLLVPRTRVKPDNVLEPSPEGTTVHPDNLIMVNPAVVYCPSNKTYFLYFKGNVYDPTWRGVHGVAVADNPEGPFKVMDDYVFEFKTEANQKLNAEDPFVWYHRKDKRFYAVFKDFTGGFTKGKPGLAIMYSEDGYHWELPENSLFMNKEILLKNGERVDVDRLERPQLLLDENDEPIALYSACSITPLNMKQDGSSFNIQIPICRLDIPIYMKIK